MFKRKITEKLIAWKNSIDKRPLIVEGARQIGKTFSITEFGKDNYKNIIYLNFILNPEFIEIFSGNLEYDTLISLLTIYFPNVEIDSENTLLFLDEIQDCPNALKSLKTFSIAKKIDVIASGSLLGMVKRMPDSFPLGYVKTIQMHPLDFEEFLDAVNKSDVITNLILDSFEKKIKIPSALKQKVDSLFKTYLLTGGLPKVVLTYLESKDFNKVDNEKKEIINGYFKDISKYGDLSAKNKAHNLFLHVPKQLADKNKKFQFSKVRKHARSRDYEESLIWLIDSGVINSISRLEKLDQIENDIDNFKIFLRDTGLLITMYENRNIWAKIMEGDYFTNEASIIKNYISDSLIKQDFNLFFYKRESGLEVDYLINLNDKLIPISIKEKINLNQTINILLNEKHKNIDFGFKISLNEFKYEKNIYTIPIYTLYLIKRFIKIINPELIVEDKEIFKSKPSFIGELYGETKTI